MKPLHRQNREFPFFEISCKPTMLQRNDYDFRNQRKILVLEMFEILGPQTLTNILLHCVIIRVMKVVRPYVAESHPRRGDVIVNVYQIVQYNCFTKTGLACLRSSVEVLVACLSETIVWNNWTAHIIGRSSERLKP